MGRGFKHPAGGPAKPRGAIPSHGHRRPRLYRRTSFRDSG